MDANVREVRDVEALAAAAELFGGVAAPAASGTVVDGPWTAPAVDPERAEPEAAPVAEEPEVATVDHDSRASVLWARYAAMFSEAMEPGFYTLAALEGDLARGAVQFWPGEASAIVTQLVNYTGGERTLEVVWQGGDPLEACRLLPGAMAWARLQGCTSILIEGRPAWERLLRDQGFTPWSRTVRKVL